MYSEHYAKRVWYGSIYEKISNIGERQQTLTFLTFNGTY